MKSILGRPDLTLVPELVGTALLAVLVWFFGPLLPPLENWPVRLAIILVMLRSGRP